MWIYTSTWWRGWDNTEISYEKSLIVQVPWALWLWSLVYCCCYYFCFFSMAKQSLVIISVENKRQKIPERDRSKCHGDSIGTGHVQLNQTSKQQLCRHAQRLILIETGTYGDSKETSQEMVMLNGTKIVCFRYKLQQSLQPLSDMIWWSLKLFQVWWHTLRNGARNH